MRTDTYATTQMAQATSPEGIKQSCCYLAEVSLPRFANEVGDRLSREWKAFKDWDCAELLN